MSQEELERRTFFFTVLILLAFAVLGGRLAHIQLVEGERWAALAQGQRIKKVEITAPRGIIVDSEGQVLAGNRPGYTVSLVYTGTEMSMDTVSRLSRILAGAEHRHARLDELPQSTFRVHEIQRTGAGASEQITSLVLQALEKLEANPLRPVEIAVDVPPEVVTVLRERLYELPGVIIEVKPIRTYPQGQLAAHLLGFVSSIEERHLAPEFQERWGLTEVGYEGDDLVGKKGIEDIRAFDSVLRGQDGEKLVEVDARGRPVETDLGQVDPVPGSSLRITIDSDLQAVAEQALARTIRRLRKGLDPVDWDPQTGLPLPFGQEGLVLETKGGPNDQISGGAAVVLDVRDGALLAAASWPSFDPNKFSLAPHLLPGTQRKEEWLNYFQALNASPDKPLLNKALQGRYPPGSTYKPLTALAALEVDRVLSPITCRGSWSRYGKTWGDWAAHGSGIGLLQALRDSCNVYFYQLADRMGMEKGRTRLAEPAARGDLEIRVENVEGLVPGDYIYLGKGEKAELHEIKWIKREQSILELAVEDQNEGPVQEDRAVGTTIAEAKSRWNNPTAWVAREFGLEGPTGIRGLPPGSEPPAWKLTVPDRSEAGEWWPGFTLNAAIGQGDNMYTPLQLAGYVATLANGGDRWVPYVVKEKLLPDGTVEEVYGPELAGKARISQESMELVRRGMLAVTEPGGTAAWRFSDWRAYGFPVKTGGKTGTAQAPGISHGLYVGFAPYDNPELAVAVVIEHGAGGSLAGAPVARAIFDEYFGYQEYWEEKQPQEETQSTEGRQLDLQGLGPEFDPFLH